MSTHEKHYGDKAVVEVGFTPMTKALDIFQYISIPPKHKFNTHLVRLEGEIGSIVHKDIVKALSCHDDLLDAAITGEAIATAQFAKMRHDDPGKEKYMQTVDRIRAAIARAKAGV